MTQQGDNVMKDMVANSTEALAGFVRKEQSPAHKKAWITHHDPALKAVENALPILEKYSKRLAGKLKNNNALRFNDLTPLEQARFLAAEQVALLGKEGDTAQQFRSFRQENESKTIADAQNIITQHYANINTSADEIHKSGFNTPNHRSTETLLRRIDDWMDIELVEDLKINDPNAYAQFLFEVHMMGAKRTKKMMETSYRRVINDPLLIAEENAKKIEDSLAQDTIDALADKIREPLMIAGLKRDNQSYAGDDNIKNVAKFLLVHMPEALVRIEQDIDTKILNAKKRADFEEKFMLNKAKKPNMVFNGVTALENGEKLSLSDALLAKLAKRMSSNDSDFEEDLIFAQTEKYNFTKAIVEEKDAESKIAKEKAANNKDDTPVVLKQPRFLLTENLRVSNENNENQKIKPTNVVPLASAKNKQHLKSGTVLKRKPSFPFLRKLARASQSLVAGAFAFSSTVIVSATLLGTAFISTQNDKVDVDQGNIMANAILATPTILNLLPADAVNELNRVSQKPSVDISTVNLMGMMKSGASFDPIIIPSPETTIAGRHHVTPTAPTSPNTGEEETIVKASYSLPKSHGDNDNVRVQSDFAMAAFAPELVTPEMSSHAFTNEMAEKSKESNVPSITTFDHISDAVRAFYAHKNQDVPDRTNDYLNQLSKSIDGSGKATIDDRAYDVAYLVYKDVGTEASVILNPILKLIDNNYTGTKGEIEGRLAQAHWKLDVPFRSIRPTLKPSV